MVDVVITPPLGTSAVAELLGLSCRQLDHFAVERLGDRPGSGYRRQWDQEDRDRLRVSLALRDALSVAVGDRHGIWPDLAEAVFNGPQPCEKWVRLKPDGLVYYSPSQPIGDGLMARWR